LYGDNGVTCGEQAKGLFPIIIQRNYRTIINTTIPINMLLSVIFSKILNSSSIFLALRKLKIYIHTKTLNNRVKCLEGP